MKITILGAGNMGLSFTKSFLKYELVQAADLQLITRRRENIAAISASFPQSVVRCFDEIEDIAADLIVLAVKPQDFPYIIDNLNFKLAPGQMVLSIMAGIPIYKIQQVLNHKKVVRAMPNSPTLLGMGITGYTAAAGMTFGELKLIERFLNATGRSVYLEDESLLDGVTALSGSGPAYFYYIVAAMVEAGKKMGLEENLSKLFVKQTMLGAYHLINNSDKNLDELILEVASKGGTTEAALAVFKQENLAEIIKEGIYSAANRARELKG